MFLYKHTHIHACKNSYKGGHKLEGKWREPLGRFEGGKGREKFYKYIIISKIK